MRKVKDKPLRHCEEVFFFSLLLLIVLPSVVSGQESYRFERMWPTLAQPWYFNYPQDVAVAPDGSVYIADSGYIRIQKYNSNGHFITMWGSRGTGDGEYGAVEGGVVIKGPEGLTIDRDGTVYVTDTYNHRIQKFTPDGTFITKWGGNGGDGSSGTGDGEFQNPSGIAADTSGYIYVADAGNHRIQKFTPDGTFITKWGRNGGDGSHGSGDGEFDNPSGITVDADGFVYVTDEENSRIQKFTSDGSFVIKWDNLFPGGAQYDNPQDIAVDDNGILYVVDRGSPTSEWYIHKINSGGQLMESWRNVGGRPSGIAVDKNGYVYITDETRNLVKKLTPTGQDLMVWSSYGTGEPQLLLPEGIAVGNNNLVYVTDHVQDCIHTFTVEGDYVALLGGEGSDPGEFNTPLGITVDDDSNIYVCDKHNGRVQKLTSDGQSITTLVSDDDLPFLPVGVALDSSGNVYVTDHTKVVDFFGEIHRHHRVQKFTPIPGESGYSFAIMWDTWGDENKFFQPFGIAVGRDLNGIEHVYVADWGDPDIAYADYGYVHKFTLDGQYRTTWTGEADGDTFYRPWGLATDDRGNVYVADYYNYRMLKFNPEGDLITSLGALGTGPGQMNLSPYMAVDQYERVFVTDKYNNRIQAFSNIEEAGNSKAIIVAGRESATDILWGATQMCANFAYRALGHQGFSNDDIYYLSADTDLDLDGDGEPDVRGEPDSNHLRYAITQWAVDQHADSLILYAVDHGGENTFRLSEQEILSAEDLLLWLNNEDLNNQLSGKTVVVYDACKSGSFLDELAEDDRIIITSTSPDERAKFLSQGTISYSSFFWTHIFNGLSVEEAHVNTTQIVNFAFSNQNPLLSGDAEHFHIGNATGEMVGGAPEIGQVSPPQDLEGEESTADLFADHVTDPDGIARVWAVIWPSHSQLGAEDIPLTDQLEEVELFPAGGNRYEGTYHGFTTDDIYYIAIYAMDRMSNTSIPSLTSVSRNYRVVKKALIVAGEDGINLSRSMIENNAGLAYDALIYQGYVDDEDQENRNDVRFMSATTFREEVDEGADVSNIENYLTTLAADSTLEHLDLIIYFIGEGDEETFRVNDRETLLASATPPVESLDLWLDVLQESKPWSRVTLVYEANHSDSFIPLLTPSEGRERIVVTSAGENGTAYCSLDGTVSFSSFFWSRVANGATLYEALAYAKMSISYFNRLNEISFSCFEQNPLLDADGNGLPNEYQDYQIARNCTIGVGMKYADDRPHIGAVSVEETGEGLITISAEDIVLTGTVQTVWAVIKPVEYCPDNSGSEIATLEEVPLSGPNEEGRYMVENIHVPFSPYKVIVYAMDEEGTVSPPTETKIYQESGWDIYEPDEVPSQATMIVVNHPIAQPHTFHYDGDEDWVAFYGFADQELTYRVTAGNLGENAKPVISLYHENDTHTPLAIADIVAGDAVVLEMPELPLEGIYYVLLRHNPAYPFGAEEATYDLKVDNKDAGGLLVLITGRVEDQESGQGIDGAFITTDGGGSAISVGGRYDLYQKPGTFHLTVGATGYQSYGRTITVETGGGIMPLDIVLPPRPVAAQGECDGDQDCDDGLFCNGSERCVDSTCIEGSNPCPELLTCDEENKTCIGCVTDADCDDKFYCTGVETCADGICWAGMDPCPEGVECDEENDTCSFPTVMIFPEALFQSRWIPLPVFLRVQGADTHFDATSEVTFDPNSLMVLPMVSNRETMFCLGLLMPIWITGPIDDSLTITIKTGNEEVTGSTEIRSLPFMLKENRG